MYMHMHVCINVNAQMWNPERSTGGIHDKETQAEASLACSTPPAHCRFPGQLRSEDSPTWDFCSGQWQLWSYLLSMLGHVPSCSSGQFPLHFVLASGTISYDALLPQH